MILLRRCLLAFLLLFAVPLQAAGDASWFYKGSDIPPDPAWQFGTLPNGLRYAIRRNPLPAGQVSIRLRIDAGALDEADHEQGWAHFVEHLAFRGTKNFGDREARHIWQQLGASFGSDTNATTDPTETVYQLDLPHADRASLDKSLAILAEMVDSALFTPAAVEAERKIVLAEKGRRPEIATRFDEVSRPLFFAGLKYEKRDTIGTDATLAAATADGLRAFYERWYRPDHATIVLAGDADPALLAELVEKHFSAWRPSAAPPPARDDGRLAEVSQRVAALAYPGAPNNFNLVWLRPHEQRPDTIANEEIDLAEQLAVQIVNRRLEAKARGDAAYISAGLSLDRARRISDRTALSLTAKDGRWRDALAESFAILADARRSPPSAAEIAREIANLRTAMNAAVAGESTMRSNVRAQQLIRAVDSGDVVTRPTVMLDLLDRLAPRMTPAQIDAALKRVLSGSGPRLLALTPAAVEGGTAALADALAAAEQAAPASRAAERSVSFDALPKLGPPGREVSRHRIEDMDVTIVRFANGSTLTFKQSDFEKGSVLVQLRFGGGLASLPADRPSPGWMSGAFVQAGVADLDIDGLERLLTGRRIGLSFNIGEDGFALAGATNAEDLPDQLRLLATKIAFPRWDPVPFLRTKAARLESYQLSFASASARAGRELGSLMRSGDARWRALEREELAATQPAALPHSFAPILATGPIQAIIVGDVDLEHAVAAMARTIGALPPRPPAAPIGDGVAPPRPDPRPRTFTHDGDPNQAFAAIGWSTFGGTDRMRERRALSVAAEILQVRLFERIREEEGATYSPSAFTSSSEAFPAWGVFMASGELKPQSIETFLRIAREEVASLAAKPVSQEEFDRARNPIVSRLERGQKTNGYWLSQLEQWTTQPELIEQTRSQLSDYRNMTAEEVRRAVAAHVADEKDWSMLVLPGRSVPQDKAGGN